jgi:hypothetical protein
MLMRRRIIHSALNVTGAAVRTYLNWREHGSAVAARERPAHVEERVFRSLRPGSVALVAMYPRGPIEDGFLGMLEALAQRGVQVVVVSTAPLPGELIARLEPVASVTLQIANIGRDFGSYQRGVAYVRETVGLDQVERLTFLNDSNYYFERADPGSLVDALLDPAHDYVASHENFEKHYHVGSFLFSLSGPVVRSDAFGRFWAEYVPYSTRVHAIDNGEVGLCRSLMRGGFIPEVVYGLHRAMPFVEQRLVRPLDDLTTWCLALRRGPLAAYAASLETGGGSISPVLLTDEVRSFLQERNQVHSLGLIFVKYLGCPFIKKDLVWNEVHLLTDLMRFAEETGVGDPALLARSFRLRGTPSQRRANLASRLMSAFGLT